MNELNPQTTSTRKSVAGETVQSAVATPQRPEITQDDSGGNGKTLPPEPAKPAAQESAPKLDDAVVKLNDYVQSLQRDLKFTIDADLGRPIVSVVDSNTQQVIRKIPNDVVIRLARNLKDVADSQQSQARSESLQGTSSVDGYSSSAAVDLGLIDTKA